MPRALLASVLVLTAAACAQVRAPVPEPAESAATVSRAAAGEHAHHDRHASHAASSGPSADSATVADPAATATAATMEGTLRVGAHIRLTPSRPASRADSARADSLAAVLRTAIARYKDVQAAEADGFEQFAPGIKGQRVYHYTNYRNAFREHFRFDPTRPTSLLYRDDGRGGRVLLGAMYVAPKRASLRELDARVPLSIAQWHAHVNICLPPRGERQRWLERRDGKPLFGPAGAIATERECEAAGGNFHEQLFGWMVHANVFESDPRKIWGDDHAAHAGQPGAPGSGGHAHQH